jgi:hypothetical protein
MTILLYDFGSLLKRSTPPANFGPSGAVIQLLEDGKFGKILGNPFWIKWGEQDPFWQGLLHDRKIKTRMATWSSKSYLTIHGRVQLVNLMCYGIPRYWVQSMCPPHGSTKSPKRRRCRLSMGSQK